MAETSGIETPATDRDRRFVFAALIAAALVYGLSLVASLVAHEPGSGAGKATLRLAVLIAFGIPTTHRVDWARWVLVAFLAAWTLEQLFWALRGNLVGFVASPIFLACAIALASAPASRFIKGAV